MTLLDHNSPKLNVHSRISLFPHQQALVHKMIELESAQTKGPLVSVLRDPPGSGKSFPLLALMLHEKRTCGKTQNLLVIPHNIHEQWLKYIATFSEELTVKSLMYYGDVTALFHNANPLNKWDILITTSTFYTMITETIKDIGASINRVVMDEIDSIAYFTEKKIPAQKIWLVSASAELTKSGVFRQYCNLNNNRCITCDPIFIKRSINLPPPTVTIHKCHNEFVEILQQNVVSPRALKAVYACDFTVFTFDYIRNEKINTAKSLLSAIFRDTCLAFNSISKALEESQISDGATYKNLVMSMYHETLEKKEKLKAEIQQIVKITERKKCPMCFDNYAEKSERLITKCCNLLLCKPCAFMWFEKNSGCPTCCSVINKDKNGDLQPDTNGVAPVVVQKDLKDKIETFEEILQAEMKRDNFRILVFSEYTGTFLHTQQLLKKHNLDFCSIEGNQYTVNRAINDYKTGKKPVLLVDALSYGSGINLEQTTAVIILHRTDRQEQIIGRAQRLGRYESLQVHHLLYARE